MKVTELETSEYNNYYQMYIEKVPKGVTFSEGFSKGSEAVLNYFKSLPDDKLNYSYAHGKWTIKEVLQHIVDTERVFSYRCFSIARQDKTPLPGFEQDDYVAPSKANSKSIEDLIEEYEAVRKNSIILVKSLSEADLKCVGTVSGGNMSARAAAFIILGHEIHHLDVLKQRYFKSE
ncbi:DinB family protein [Tamlana sp. 2_MG-2023]|uniref:DinB family protein n=1 Tax=unclassified Tamlana TaxID=2614803 RepID=UPI0026E400A8|nr:MULTISPECIES: DinB family protein [unclassified Tamlana]MDO6759238.1 DinB family protein [Tamlana sp. 2_MG-2023]MDO6790623.1 DinB family protein [Tamlana sp. 1_MG-2023]